MARGLELSLRMIGAVHTERTLRAEYERQADERLVLLASLERRRKLLEILLDIQRSISHRAPLPTVLEAITAGAGVLLEAPAVLVLDDALDIARPIVTSASAVNSVLVAQAVAAAAEVDGTGVVVGDGTITAPVHVNGVPAGALVAIATDEGDFDHGLLTAFAEHASLALSDARTVEAMEEAFHDRLTELPNRALFTDRLAHALDVAARRDSPLAVLFIDLDRFKAVNDTLGHAAGDELMRAVAGRLRKCVRDSDTAARFGGDEFAVLLEDAGSAPGPEQVADRIIAAIHEPFEIAGREVFIGATVGIAYAIGDRMDPDVLLQNADLAMYRAKRAGGDRSGTFAPAMREALMERFELEGALRVALQRGELSVAYQPIVRLDTGAIVGLEALARWDHPTRGPISPALFIPLAEETGVILEIGTWLRGEACERLAAWRTLLPGLELSVNLSAAELRADTLPHELESTLQRLGLPGSALALEITERLLVDDPGTQARLERLRHFGIAIAIDDFGTGYSSLGYLQRFPVDILKIDQSFVQGKSALAGAIVNLGRTMDIKTIAEGIETRVQADHLRSLGCQLAQGYHFGRPMAADAFTERLQAEVERLAA